MTPTHPTDRRSLERDCQADFFVSSGPGGQRRNRKKTGVRLVHSPTGTVVTATELRSQARNLEVAYRRMQQRLAALNRPRKKRKRTTVSKAARERRLKQKAHRSETKRLRRKPES